MRSIFLTSLLWFFIISSVDASSANSDIHCFKIKQDNYLAVEKDELHQIGYQMIESSQFENKLTNSTNTEISYKKNFDEIESIITFVHKTDSVTGITVLSPPRFKMEVASVHYMKDFDSEILLLNEQKVLDSYQKILSGLTKFRTSCKTRR